MEVKSSVSPLIDAVNKELEEESNEEAKKLIKRKLKEIKDARVIIRNLERELSEILEKAENGLL